MVDVDSRLAVFSLISFINVGVGPIMAGWIETNPKLEWKWIEWVQMTYVVPAVYQYINDSA